MENVPHICRPILISFNVQAARLCKSPFDLGKKGQDMRRKRRSGNYRNFRNSRQNRTKLNFTPVVAILLLSVGCGYATAKYVVDPVVNYVPTLTAEDETAESMQPATADADAAGEPSAETEGTTQASRTDIVADDAKVAETGEVAGYALQFGCYSGKAAAEAAMKEIDASGLQVLEQNNMYKIIGRTYDTREKAAAALKELPDAATAFVTAIYK